MYGSHAFAMILGFPRLLLQRKNHEKYMEIFAFSIILGFPRFPLHRRNTWLWNGCREAKGTGGGGTRMVYMRNRGHEVDPVEGTSFRKKIHRFFPRSAQGPHKVRSRSTSAGSSPEANLVKIGGGECVNHMKSNICWVPGVEVSEFCVCVQVRHKIKLQTLRLTQSASHIEI